MTQKPPATLNRIAKGFNLRCLEVSTKDEQTQYLFQEVQQTYPYAETMFLCRSSAGLSAITYPILCRTVRQGIDNHTANSVPPVHL